MFGDKAPQYMTRNPCSSAALLGSGARPEASCPRVDRGPHVPSVWLWRSLHRFSQAAQNVEEQLAYRAVVGQPLRQRRLADEEAEVVGVFPAQVPGEAGALAQDKVQC